MLRESKQVLRLLLAATRTRWTVPDRGLHFPAAETPELYVDELRAFFRHLR